jgi:Periplasmic copper-binding protein (NosD)
MIIKTNNTSELLRAYDKVQDGDVIQIFPGTYPVTPQPPLRNNYPAWGGGALALMGKQGVTVEGVGWPLIQSTNHGTVFTFHECTNCSLSHVHVKGNGYLTTHDHGLIAFSGILTTRSPFLRIEDNIVDDMGDQGISELHMDGPEGSHHLVVSGNLIRRCGMLTAPAPFIGDGAAIALGSWDMDIHDNIAQDCFRGFELETNNPNAPTCRNRITRNRFERSISAGITVIVEHQNADLFVDNEISHNVVIGRGKPDPELLKLGWTQQEHGIVIMGGRRFSVHHNLVRDLSDWKAFELGGKCELTDCDFDSNTAINCGRGGFWNAPAVPAQAGHSFRHNRVNCPGGPGFYITGADMMFEGNIVTPPTTLDYATGMPWPKCVYNGTVL